MESNLVRTTTSRSREVTVVLGSEFVIIFVIEVDHIVAVIVVIIAQRNIYLRSSAKISGGQKL